MATPSSNSSVSLGPWTRGFQNFYDHTKAPPDTLAVAINVLIDADGTIRSSTGLKTTNGGPDLNADIHSVFPHKGRFFGVFRDTISEFFDGRHISLNFPVGKEVKWTVFEDSPVFYNRDVIGKISLTDAAVGASGGTYIVKSEYPSDASTPEPAPHPYRDLFTASKRAMPTGGDVVRYWRSRLLVARGPMLYISDPFMYSTYDAVSGIIALPGRIDFMEVVEGGVFVGLSELGVYFLAGSSPENWQLKIADVITGCKGTSLLIPTAGMKLDAQTRPEWVAVWLTCKGFALGLPNGSVIYPQADLLQNLTIGAAGRTTLYGDRLIVSFSK